MSNKFGIPEEELKKIRERDKKCVYCNKKMIKPKIGYRRIDWATIEHFREKGPFYWPELKKEDIAICCSQCNSSRGRKELSEWFKSQYCLDRVNKINEKTVADPVKRYLNKKKRKKS